MKSDCGISAAESRRLDQWLWFARLVKSRSLAARLCTAGAITVNQAMITKANHIVRIGDTIGVPQGAFRRSVRLLGLGVRRGPAVEARHLYEEIAAPVHRSELTPAWTPLLAEEDGALTRSRSNLSGKQSGY
ncbi:MAG TPA: RNA-binding S4 domain-containing protein [Stellaceae bacterium]|nr:RNA-binding S4 domain-containing protein [Stellaceae bacterium]